MLKSKRAILTKNISCNGSKIVAAKGLYITIEGGKTLLDFSSQTLNLNFGQRHPEVLKAIADYVKKSPTFISSRFLNSEFVSLANLLVKIGPTDLTTVNLKLSNGSDANESAFKRVRTFRKKKFIISYRFSHLGETSETIQASGGSLNKIYIGGSTDFIFINPQFMTCKHDLSRPCSLKCLSHIQKLFQSRKDIAGIILEPVMVNAGGYEFTRSYLSLLRQLCDRHDVSLIFDEVQTAFGWMGYYFAAQRYSVTPDVLTLGKGLAAGLPLAGILMKSEYDVLDYGMDEFTYGGHPLSIKVALRMLKYLRKSLILGRVRKKEIYFRQKLEELRNKYASIVEIRVAGLIAGIEFLDNRTANYIYDECFKRGLLLRKTKDAQGESLVLKPAIIVTKIDINRAISILDATLACLS